jgi:uncharacterized repeat protein (TIGR03803 family)
MKTSSGSRPCRLLRLVVSAFTLGIYAAPAARAGLTMEMDLVLDNNTYSFFPNLGTNTASPAVPFGNYFVASPGYPTNPAYAQYHFDTNGFIQVGGSSSYGFAVFDAPNFNDSFIQNITNGQWSIFVTNSAVTNVYHFTVTASIVSNSMPPVVVIYPPNNALNVTNQPTFLWQGGPTNYSDLMLYQDANNVGLPVTQTSYFGFTAASGLDGFNVHYDLFSSNAVVSSVPTNSASQPLSSWVSTAHLQDLASSQFTVSSPVADFNADLNTTNLPWATMGDAAWFTETTNTYNGAPAAAQSGSVTGSQASTLSVIVTGPGTLTYYWSSIASGSFSCEFDVDGNYSNNIAGHTAWYQVGPYAIGPGRHTLSWTSYANGDTDPTEAGFLDNVSFVTASAPTLTVTVSPLSGLAPLAVQFTSPGVDSLGHTVTNWNWTFGDGGISLAQSPSHTYTNAGSYFPGLTAYSTFGSAPLSVSGPGTITVTNLTLNVSATPSSGVAPLTVQFASPGVDSGGNTVTNWNWNFGDGGNSTAQNPSHVYTAVGAFSPSLAARSTSGTSPLTVTGLGGIIVYSNPIPAFHTLYTFTTNFGTGPNAGLALSGNTLYGTTVHGGISSLGTVFAVNTDGTGFTNLYNNFIASFINGGDPGAGVIVSGGTLYGTTSLGGPQGGGTVFAIGANGMGYTNLLDFYLNFTPPNGQQPLAPVVLSGNTLYGTTWYGGSVNHGTVFSVTTNGASSSILHSFSTPSFTPNASNYDGLFPSAKLICPAGTLYGTTEQGGTNGGGTVFSVVTNQSGSFSILHYFSAPVNGTNRDGAYSFAGLVLSGTNLYGTTYGGGTYGYGTIFAVSTNGTGFTNVYSFTGGSDGSGPHGGLTLSGNILYGTTSAGGNYTNGTLFAIKTDGSGFTSLYTFTGGGDGGNPGADLVLSGGTLYGTAASGGSGGNGTVFSFTLARPVLAIARSGTNVVLTWSASASGYNLEFATNLVSSAVWNTNLPAPVILNGLNTVTNAISPSSKFYRLRQ